MEIKEQVTLRFKGVDFTSVQLSSSTPYVESEDNKIDISINPRAFIPKDSADIFKILMDIELNAVESFNLKITAIGTFQLSQNDVSDEIRRAFINANSTAIMFPYVRSFITTLTSNLGRVTTPIILPTRFFKGDYLQTDKEE